MGGGGGGDWSSPRQRLGSPATREPGARKPRITPLPTHHLLLRGCPVGRPGSLQGRKLGLQSVDALRALLLQSEHLLLRPAALPVRGGLGGGEDSYPWDPILCLRDPKMGSSRNNSPS